MSKKNHPYQIFHHNGTYTEVGQGVFLRHLTDNHIVRTANKRGVVREGLTCYAVRDRESGDLTGELCFTTTRAISEPVPSSWEQALRAWLLQKPFPAETHFNEKIKQGMSRMQAYVFLEDNGYLRS